MFPRRLYLTCHGLGTPPAGTPNDVRQFWLPVEEFTNCVDLAQHLERRAGIEIRFTFDDGNESDFTEALPVLRARRRTGMFFVCAGRIGQQGFLDAGQIAEMVSAGMTIGCHGYDHIDWCKASDSELRHEMIDGRRMIEAATGCPVEFASSPFGSINVRVVRFAAKAGFKCLFSSSGGFATGHTGLIPRTSLRAGFVASRDLPRMVTRSERAWASWYDAARRVKYGFR